MYRFPTEINSISLTAILKISIYIYLQNGSDIKSLYVAFLQAALGTFYYQYASILIASSVELSRRNKYDKPTVISPYKQRDYIEYICCMCVCLCNG